jgi:hypothetical protein
MAPDSSRKRLPFEPKKKRQEAGKPSAEPVTNSSSQKPGKSRDTKSQRTRAKGSAASGSATGIPEVVSQRMLRRMLTFSGVPTALGVITFFVSYWLIVRDVVEFPPYFVLFATLGCFGLGVLGLSYGALSASWDETRTGNWLGLEEFKVNFGRMTEAWRSRADS